MNILICDDEVEYLERLKEHIEKYMNEKLVNYNIDVSTQPKEIMTNDEAYDLAFLDIQMDEVDGFSLARELKNRNGKVVIFFVTSYNEFQDEAMDLRAFRFFEKDFDISRLYSGLDKAMEYIDETYVDFFTYDRKDQVKLATDEIIYIENKNRKLLISTVDNQYAVRDKLENFIKKLPQSFFYLVHKSFFVNLHYVNRYGYSELILNDGTRIPIASKKQADFHKYWFAYLRKR